ncbi:UcrQ family protein [Cooperia oncophora]
MSGNYYYTRDGRRQVLPPKPIYLADGHQVQFGTHTGEVLAQQDAVAPSNMRPTVVSMSKHFGALGKMYGEYRFALSPNEQKAFKGFLDQAVVKVFRNYVWYEWPYYLLRSSWLSDLTIGQRRRTTRSTVRIRLTTRMISKSHNGYINCGELDE